MIEVFGEILKKKTIIVFELLPFFIFLTLQYLKKYEAKDLKPVLADKE